MKGFTPMLVWYDEESHIKAEALAEAKLRLLDDASVWVNNQLDLKDTKISNKKLHSDMVEYFNDLVLKHFMSSNHLGLSANKLIEAKEIPVFELAEIQKEYESERFNFDVTFPNNIPTIEIHKKDFETWTRNEKQNKKVVYGNQFIKAINDLSSIGVKTYPVDITRASSNYILYDMQANKYVLNRQEIFG